MLQSLLAIKPGRRRGFAAPCRTSPLPSRPATLAGLFLGIALALFLAGAPVVCPAEVVVIGDAALPELDHSQLSRIYTGRTVQAGGVPVKPVNLQAGDPLRATFLQAVLGKTDDAYVAYWIVRRSIGRGTPPTEVGDAREVIDFVRTTRGAIGYIDQANLVPDVKVLLTLP